MMQTYKKIEVAFFKSTFFDAAGADEKTGKGKTPKEERACQSIPGHTVNNCVTVIRISDGALSDKILFG